VIYPNFYYLTWKLTWNDFPIFLHFRLSSKIEIVRPSKYAKLLAVWKVLSWLLAIKSSCYFHHHCFFASSFPSHSSKFFKKQLSMLFPIVSNYILPVRQKTKCIQKLLMLGAKRITREKLLLIMIWLLSHNCNKTRLKAISENYFHMLLRCCGKSLCQFTRMIIMELKRPGMDTLSSILGLHFWI
jgi:hypothetical protein